MRTIVVGDIHGGLKGLEQVLKRSQLTEADRLIFVGDYVDGWSESAQVIQFLIDLAARHSCVFIKGNHDVWCENWLRTGKAEKVWLEHGGEGTIESYNEFSEEGKKKHLDFFETMELYHLDAQQRLFIHAGFTSMHGVEEESYTSTFYYDRTLWEMALTMDENIDVNSDKYPKRLKQYHEIFIGHTPTINFHDMEPMQAVNVWNVDTGAAFFGKLSALDIDSKAFVQSDILMELYPDEKGRNERSLNQILGR